MSLPLAVDVAVAGRTVTTRARGFARANAAPWN